MNSIRPIRFNEVPSGVINSIAYKGESEGNVIIILAVVAATRRECRAVCLSRLCPAPRQSVTHLPTYDWVKTCKTNTIVKNATVTMARRCGALIDWRASKKSKARFRRSLSRRRLSVYAGSHDCLHVTNGVFGGDICYRFN